MFEGVAQTKRTSLRFVVVWIVFDMFVDFLSQFSHAASALRYTLYKRTLYFLFGWFLGGSIH